MQNNGNITINRLVAQAKNDISQLLLWNQENPVTLSWIATAFLLFAVLFALGRRNPEPAPQLATTT